jgi:hypothetical protein
MRSAATGLGGVHAIRTFLNHLRTIPDRFRTDLALQVRFWASLSLCFQATFQNCGHSGHIPDRQRESTLVVSQILAESALLRRSTSTQEVCTDVKEPVAAKVLPDVRLRSDYQKNSICLFAAL